MKKNLYLLLVIFLLSGCSTEYNLELNDATLTEKIKIGEFDSANVEGFGFLTPYAINTDEEQDFYEFDYNNKYLNLKYKYALSNYEKSEALNNCYEFANFSYDDNYYYLLTSKEFKCLTYDKYKSDNVKINFTTNYNVISTNADYVDGNTYTWIINDSNSHNKPINIKLEKKEDIKVEKEEKKDEEPQRETSFQALYILIGVLAIIIGLAALYLINKSQKRDEI